MVMLVCWSVSANGTPQMIAMKAMNGSRLLAARLVDEGLRHVTQPLFITER